ncbi:MAG TPA: branched-chain amino acid ABC transporter permease [Candidatus Binataceae bacterium]|nr:branched-chain amino acid ABC transporter permease [Candidatus Binataceae bacterium]
MLEYALLGGLLYGLYYGLVGLGLNLVFGVMRIVNLAHGDFLMLGAFGTIWLYGLLHLSPLGTIFIALAVFVALGVPLYYLLVPRLLRAKDPEMLSLLLFFGLSQVIEAIATIVFGPSEQSIPGRALGAGPIHILGQGFPAAWVVSAATSVVAVLAVYVYLYRTRLGYLTRAVMVHREEALASGIDVNRVSAIAFGVGLALAAIAGVFAPFMLGGVTPTMGVELIVQAFVVIVIGSLGNPLGTVLGGIVYGVSLMFMQTYFSSWADLLPYVLLIVILLARPSGLLGRQVRSA